MSRLSTVWHLLNLSCREMTRLASESHDRDLGRLERIALKTHVLYCKSCRRYLTQIALLRRAMRRFVTRLEGDLPIAGPDLPPGVRDRIKRALKEN